MSLKTTLFMELKEDWVPLKIFFKSSHKDVENHFFPLYINWHPWNSILEGNNLLFGSLEKFPKDLMVMMIFSLNCKGMIYSSIKLAIERLVETYKSSIYFLQKTMIEENRVISNLS